MLCTRISIFIFWICFWNIGIFNSGLARWKNFNLHFLNLLLKHTLTFIPHFPHGRYFNLHFLNLLLKRSGKCNLGRIYEAISIFIFWICFWNSTSLNSPSGTMLCNFNLHFLNLLLKQLSRWCEKINYFRFQSSFSESAFETLRWDSNENTWTHISIFIFWICFWNKNNATMLVIVVAAHFNLHFLNLLLKLASNSSFISR